MARTHLGNVLSIDSDIADIDSRVAITCKSNTSLAARIYSDATDASVLRSGAFWASMPGMRLSKRSKPFSEQQ